MGREADSVKTARAAIERSKAEAGAANQYAASRVCETLKNKPNSAGGK
jgi:hypothetical protein